MIYTKPWEYRLGIAMLVFTVILVVACLVMTAITITSGDINIFLYVALALINGFYMSKYIVEIKDYRKRRGNNG